MTKQKLWKIGHALSLTNKTKTKTTTDATLTSSTTTNAPSIDTRANISLRLARAACQASFNDLILESQDPQLSDAQRHVLQRRIQALRPDVESLVGNSTTTTTTTTNTTNTNTNTNTNTPTTFNDPFAQNYLHFIEASIPIIESTCLGQHALQHVLQHHTLVQGLWMEFGVAKGTTLSSMAKAAKVTTTTGQQQQEDIVVHGFDSFLGLPSDWRVGFEVGKFSRQGCPPTLEEQNIKYHVGWFEETLPIFLSTLPRHLACALIHIDCDVYESAACVLRCLCDRIVAGTILVFDELLNYNGFERHEMHALFEVLMMEDTSSCIIQHNNDGNNSVNTCSTCTNLKARGLDIEWIGSKHAGCMDVALRVVVAAKQ